MSKDNNDTIRFAGNSKRIASAWNRARRVLGIRLEIPEDDDTAGACSTDSDCGHRHSRTVAGYGKKEFEFPSIDELVRGSIAYIYALQAEYEKHGQRFEIGSSSDDESSELFANDSERRDFIDFICRSVKKLSRQPLHAPARKGILDHSRHEARTRGRELEMVDLSKVAGGKKLIPDLDGKLSPTPGSVLRVAAGTLAKILHQGRYAAVISRQFDPFKGAVNWALGKNPEGRFNAPEKYHPVASSLLAHLNKLEDIYSEALPRVMMFLAAQYSKASEAELLEAAVSVLNEQLTPILYVLGIWTDGFYQRMHGMYPEVDYIHYLVEESLRLFLSRGAKSKVFHVDDVFMGRFCDQGPATIPAGRGPVGAHAIEVPFDERPVLMIFSPLYAHEFDHDIFEDVEGLKQEMTEAVVKALKAADRAGKFKFTNPHIMLGKQKVKTVDLLIQIWGQTLSESHADAAGGVCLTGDAYGYLMAAAFCAFNIGGGSVFDKNRMLRPSSVFGVTEEGELGFEPHMPDYPRMLFVADVFESIGDKAVAAELRTFAVQGVGVPTPKYCIWRNIDPKSKFQFDIQVLVEDLMQGSPIVVDTILHAKLPALGGLSHWDLINWTPHRQKKVDALVGNILQGSAEIPWGMGDFLPNYVAAAAAKAAWATWKSGHVAPEPATYAVEATARKMMDAVKARQDATAGGTVLSVPAPAAPPAAAPAATSTPAPAATSTPAPASGDPGAKPESPAAGSSAKDQSAPSYTPDVRPEALPVTEKPAGDQKPQD